MALAAADLIAPKGKLQASLWPAGDLLANATEWLAQAYAKTTAAGIDATNRDAAAREYAYYLAYSHVADRLAGEPNSVSIDSAANLSKAIGDDRIKYFAGLAQDHLENFESYADLPPPAEKPRSTWTQTKVVF